MPLVASRLSDQFGRYACVDILDGFQDSATLVSVGVAIPEFDSLVSAGGCAGRNQGPAPRSVFQAYVDLYSRIAPGVEDFSCPDAGYITH